MAISRHKKIKLLCCTKGTAGIGNKSVMAFYEPDNGRCAVNAVIYDKTDAYTGMTTAARVPRSGAEPFELFISFARSIS